MFEWNSDLQLDVEEIDRNHQELLSRAHSLDEAVKAGEPAEELSRKLMALIEVTVAHFGAEERMMIRRGYENYPGHKAAHDKLLEQIYMLRDEFAAGRIDPSSPLLALFILVWTRDHITGPDQAFARHLRAADQSRATVQ
jgi:hemerythrin